MQYVSETTKNINDACQSFEEIIELSDFGILHVHDMEETMQKKGVSLGESCRVYEICNPHLAKEILSVDMSANMLLPCRISIYTENNSTKIGMVNPTQLIKASARAETLMAPALIVEEKLQALIKTSI